MEKYADHISTKIRIDSCNIGSENCCSVVRRTWRENTWEVCSTDSKVVLGYIQNKKIKSKPLLKNRYTKSKAIHIFAMAVYLSKGKLCRWLF